ncbi:MAG: aminodeoxychorismate/anthranilate synthase component II [Actinobacteria bacterium]|nr:aminodeoxychorismate/anthranilate synthase component II [Actinomycetota bacterium]
MSTPPPLLLIDNYDSFTHNLAQCFWMLGQDVTVIRNDQITVEDVETMRPRRVVISPGPGHPSSAGICADLVRRLSRRIPVLGVCLGHQCLAHAFGGDVVRACRIMHGKTSSVQHDGAGLHSGIPQGFPATRYHSLVVREDTLPAGFRVTARARDDGAVMAIADDDRGLYGLQYHPESILTLAGMDVLRNFLDITTAPALERTVGSSPKDITTHSPHPERAHAEEASCSSR